MRKMNYCIIPITLSPLGLNKKCSVVAKTLKQIREINKNAFLFTLVNNYMPLKQPIIVTRIIEEYRRRLLEIEQDDPQFKFIDPEKAAIRNSQALYYWGREALFNQQQALAFDLHGGRSYPRDDFLKLADYLAEFSEDFRERQ